MGNADLPLNSHDKQESDNALTSLQKLQDNIMRSGEVLENMGEQSENQAASSSPINCNQLHKCARRATCACTRTDVAAVQPVWCCACPLFAF